MSDNEEYNLPRLNLNRYFSISECSDIFEHTIVLTARITKLTANCSAVRDFQKTVNEFRKVMLTINETEATHSTMSDVMFCYQSLKKYLDAMTTDPDENIALLAQKYFSEFENQGGISDKPYDIKYNAVSQLIARFSRANEREFMALGVNSRFTRLIKCFKNLDTEEKSQYNLQQNNALAEQLRENAVYTFNRLVNHVEQMTQIEGVDFYGEEFTSAFKNFLFMEKDIENNRRKNQNSKKTITIIKPKDEFDVEFEIETNEGD